MSKPLATVEAPKVKPARLNPPRQRTGEHWEKIRKEFVESPHRLQLTELAVKHGLPIKSVHVASFDEGWGLLRAKRIEQDLADSDAAQMVLEAASASRAITSAGQSVALLSLQEIAESYARLPTEGGAASSRASVVNTLTFALANVAKAMKDLGVIGFAGELDKFKKDNNKWDPKLLAQINITIGDLLKSASSAKVDTEPVTVASEDAPPSEDCV